MFRTSAGEITAIDYDKENPVNTGSLCPRGYYNLELLNHPQRLTKPRIGKKEVTWDEAISFAKKELKKHDPSSIKMTLSSNASNEDAYMACVFAKTIGITDVSASGDPADQDSWRGNKWDAEGATLDSVERLGESEALLIIGDILTRSPVLSKRINKVKYGKRGNKIIAISPSTTHTSWFATTHLKNKPGTEAALMAAIVKVLADINKRENIDLDLEKTARITGIPVEAITQAAKAFDDAESGSIIFSPENNIQKNDIVQYLAKVASGFSVNKKHITLNMYGNTIGVNRILDAMSEKKKSEHAKAFIAFGDNTPIHGTEFTVRSCYFAPDTVRENEVILPLASHMERKGSVILAGERTENIRPIAHKVGGRSHLEIITSLMDTKVEFDKILEETEKILSKKVKKEKVDLGEKISEALKMGERAIIAPGDVTHFGNNELVKRFFWYRVNNG
jgi:anaerobic selenocysteine-containing dehydrogenase